MNIALEHKWILWGFFCLAILFVSQLWYEDGFIHQALIKEYYLQLLLCASDWASDNCKSCPKTLQGSHVKSCIIGGVGASIIAFLVCVKTLIAHYRMKNVWMVHNGGNTLGLWRQFWFVLKMFYILHMYVWRFSSTEHSLGHEKLVGGG